MQDGRLQAHAQSFSAGADGYDAHRPSYPRAVVAWLLDTVPTNADDPSVVVDVGAGTGKLTGILADLGATVSAIDPSADMLRVLNARLPHVSALQGTAESLPIPDSSVDLVTFAQAWHWVDVEAATAEVLRVLKPGGRLGLIWNSRDDSVPWVADLSRAMNPGLHAAGSFAPTLGTGLSVVAQRTDRWTQQTTRDDILSLATTRSYYLVATKSEQAGIRSRITAVLDAHAETSEDPVLLPYVTEAWIAAPESGE